MDIKDVYVGMKVRLLGKHGVGDNFNDIEKWYKVGDDNGRKILKSQGYGYVVEINDVGDIWVDECEDGKGWCFLASDLEPYEEKSPKEWLLTTGVIFTTGDNSECVTLGDGTAYMLNGIGLWSDDLEGTYTDNLKYYDDCPLNDIIKIEYKGKVVWERKINYVSFDEAVKSGKRIKNEKWINFFTLQEALEMLRISSESTAREEITGLWEIEE